MSPESRPPRPGSWGVYRLQLGLGAAGLGACTLVLAEGASSVHVRPDAAHHLDVAGVGLTYPTVNVAAAVLLALAALEHPLRVQAPEDRHVRRVGAGLGRPSVDGLHHSADGRLVQIPHGVHHLGLDGVQRGCGLGCVCHTTECSRPGQANTAPALTITRYAVLTTMTSSTIVSSR